MAQAFVDEEIKKPAVVFSKSYCPFCKMAKAVLNEVGAKYTVHELDERGIYLYNTTTAQQLLDELDLL